MSFHILTDAELEELTGYATAAKQKEVLSRNGIYFIEGKGGKIRTTSENIRFPLSAMSRAASQSSGDGFNLEAI
ncbi:DUF4224 domain-containing protein [Pseudaeromonas paramecii]|uniref:DUF4224 domain-containing protein n=1 Tax=Pseudaeromonas paramecii TaxID=2138166 RepID=A0ABP8PWH9_9GAMM